MHWTLELLDRLAKRPRFGYHEGSSASTEPTALAAVALLAAGRYHEATRALCALADSQQADGHVAVWVRSSSGPGWGTSLALLAWSTDARLAKPSTDRRASDRYRDCAKRAVDWILELRGTTRPHGDEIGHNTELVGWPWVRGTHSWVEPTAMHLLALTSAGYGQHARAREAAALLVDRLLPEGGCNTGVTFVLGQKLRPHVQPTGLAMLALAGRTQSDPRVGNSLDFLEASLTPRTSTTSLCYGLLGLAAHGRPHEHAEAWLAAAYRRTIAATRATTGPGDCDKLALLALAAPMEASSLVMHPNLEPFLKHTESTAN
jgi:hypothetical protein